MDEPSAPNPAQVLQAMQAWLHDAVIGLNLCPFAKHVVTKGRLAWRISEAADEARVYEDLAAALEELAQTDADLIDTTLLVLPHALQRFDDFQLFLQLQAAPLLKRMGLRGVLQIAPFHPQFVFAEVADAHDISHCTNRSPWPALHLLREASLERAIASPGGDAERIVAANLATLQRLGAAGWASLSAAWASGKATTESSGPQGSLSSVGEHP